MCIENLTSREAREILIDHGIEVSFEDKRSIVDIALSAVMRNADETNQDSSVPSASHDVAIPSPTLSRPYLAR